MTPPNGQSRPSSRVVLFVTVLLLVGLAMMAPVGIGALLVRAAVAAVVVVLALTVHAVWTADPQTDKWMSLLQSLMSWPVVTGATVAGAGSSYSVEIASLLDRLAR